MRREDLEPLRERYPRERGRERDRRFDLAIGADIPNASRLVTEIFNDLSRATFGVSWWGSLPVHEKILISDSLYQCADSIETNMVEARLHYLEWLDAREKENTRLADIVRRDEQGGVEVRMPPSLAPIDDLYGQLETLHECGFFRAIGSSLDCLGGAIVGVLALSTSLRRSDIATIERRLPADNPSGDPGIQLQVDFRDFFQRVKLGCGPEDWLAWTTQYRKMFVHRGRRTTQYQIVDRDVGLYGPDGLLIPRFTTTVHLAKYPDKSEVEAMILNDTVLNEDADVVMSGVFRSCRELQETVCERLVAIWQQRRGNPALLEQPVAQWNDVSRPCNFNGYDPAAPPLTADAFMSHPIYVHRLMAASSDDAHRALWRGSGWGQ